MSAGSYIQIDLANKVIRTDRLLQVLQDLQRKGKSPEQISDEIAGTSVVTTYGSKKHTYRVESIDFSRSPACTFLKGKPGEEVEVSFKDYYKQQYNEIIKEEN